MLFATTRLTLTSLPLTISTSTTLSDPLQYGIIYRNHKRISLTPRTFLLKVPDPPGLPPRNNHKYYIFGNNEDGVPPFLRSHGRPEVMTTSPRFMGLIYKIGRVMLGSINTFSPQTDVALVPNFSVEESYFIPSDQPGHYSSTIYSISDYANLIDAICAMDHDIVVSTNNIYTDTLLLAVVSDFQAWVAQLLSSIPFYVHGIAFLRWLIVQDIISNANARFNDLDISKVFIHMATHVAPFVDLHRASFVPSYYIITYKKRFGPYEYAPQHYCCYSKIIDSCNITEYCMYAFQADNISSVRDHSQRYIIDTGASVSATSNRSILDNVRTCTDMVAYPAFGPQITPKLRGELGQLGLNTGFIDNMPDTLISVSQFFRGQY